MSKILSGTDTSASSFTHSGSETRGYLHWGTLWLCIAVVAAGFFFWEGIGALLEAWKLPEYSHGPLIPLLSGLLFLRQLKEYPPNYGKVDNRWIGVGVIFVSFLMGALGTLSNIADISAYGLILWVGGMLLVSFGWSTGKHFWPGVVHLVYMLPLPGVLYYKLTTWLQYVSSELGVWFLEILSIPVFLEGNIIDLGVTKLHVAEACSGLRYLFPIMSFSYIFAALYKGSVWHKAILLLAAVPITIFMNSFRIAVAGIIVNYYGVEWVDGLTHFFEGWVVFIACIALLFLLAWVMLKLSKEKMTLVEALDLDTDGLGTQLKRVRLTRASKSLIASACLIIAGAVTWQLLPERGGNAPERDSFVLFPRTLDDWKQEGRANRLSPAVAAVLAADDYHDVQFTSPNHAFDVGLFMAWYDDQSKGGVHSPEICLPGAGWEIAWLERTDLSAQFPDAPQFEINRAVIQKGEVRMLVYYWFEQRDRRIAWDFEAKYRLMVDGIQTGRTDGALVRLTTLIGMDESEADAEVRLKDMLLELQDPLPRFIPKS